MAVTIGELDLSDHYRDALREMIEAKISGSRWLKLPRSRPPVIDLMSALKQSLESAKTKRKPMVLAKGPKAEPPSAAATKSDQKQKAKKAKVA